jgi:hypothetical protein
MAATVLPSLAAAMAAFCPPGPEPMTTRSYSRIDGCMCVSLTAPADILRVELIRELGGGVAVRRVANLVAVARVPIGHRAGDQSQTDWSVGG